MRTHLSWTAVFLLLAVTMPAMGQAVTGPFVAENSEVKAARPDVAAPAGKTPPQENWLKKVDPNRVDMALNRTLQRRHDAVTIEGKTYFVYDERSALRLAKDPALRVTKDPFTGNVIDKSDSVIYADPSGRAYYFESEETFKKFLSQGPSRPIQGYSEPE